MSKHMNRFVAGLAILTAAIAFGWPAAAEIALDQGNLKPFEAQLPDFGKPNRTRASGTSVLVSHSNAS